MIKKVFLIYLVLILALASFVLAAGSSSGNAQNNNACQTDNDCIVGPSTDCCGEVNKCYNVNEDIPSPPTCSPLLGCPSLTGPTSCKCINAVCVGNTQSITTTSCEDKSTIKDRIKCRFENPSVAYKEAYQAVEEACRDDRYKEKCERLYKASSYCYNEDNISERKKCFLKESGISINSQGTFRAAPDDSKRNYVVLLLYELQERIEDMQSEGKITVDQATSLIEKIVGIKKMILAKEPRSEIVIKINEFKQEYKTVMSGVEQ